MAKTCWESMEAPDAAKRREVPEQVHARAHAVLPYINAGQYRAGQYRAGHYRAGHYRAGHYRAGQYRTLGAHRANIGRLRATTVPVFWGIEKK